MPNRCRVLECTAEPTHILLTARHTWARTAVQADQAPDIVVNNIVEIRTPGLVEHGKPQPYYCQGHAEEKSSHGNKK